MAGFSLRAVRLRRAAAGLVLALGPLIAGYAAAGAYGTVGPQGGAVDQRDGIATLIRRLEEAARAGNRAGVLALGDPAAGADLEDFATALTTPAPSRLIANERDRVALAKGTERVIVEVFSERGMEALIGTWRVDVRPGSTPADPWRIIGVSPLSVAGGLYRLTLDTTKQYAVHNLVVEAPDLALEMASGTAFVAETPEGPTAVVLMGRGHMRFTPPSASERTQIRILSGRDTLNADFDRAFIRLRPDEFASRFPPGSLTAETVDLGKLRTATGVFNTYVGQTLQLDLRSISRDRWSLVPASGDLIAEIRTKKLGSLTYARSSNEAEDVSLFNRARRRNISAYASAEKLAERGRFYSEDDLVDYDVTAYDIDVELVPERAFIEGQAKVKVRIQAESTNTLTLRLAESLFVRGVYSPDFGRLLHLRVVGQNSLIVNLPAFLTRGTELSLDVHYSGQLAAQEVDREAIDLGGQDGQDDGLTSIEPRYLYSNRSYWYPQSRVTDYATANLRLTTPGDFTVVATGDPLGPPAPAPGVAVAGQRGRKVFVFNAARPARYLGFIVARLSPVATRSVAAGGSSVALSVLTSPRQAARGRGLMDQTAAVFQFYASLVGDAPYPTFTLTLAESDRPGGHSPPYFAVLNHVVTRSPFVWRNDPVSFASYPTFFLAHEIAHQWWGHAVGWKNYHEQWLSEGFAQYFAVLYAEKEREGSVLADLLRQMRQTAVSASSQGPIHLGYRLGHIQGDARVFRAVVYNKSAMVLHMLRRLVGDEAFFTGVRHFYEEWRFKKAGTDDFRQAMERTSGRDLRRFFEAWIYGASIPRLKFGYRVAGGEAVVRFEQKGDAVDVPVTVTVAYTSGQSEDTVIALSEQITERTLPLKGVVRLITANGDSGALVEIEK